MWALVSGLPPEAATWRGKESSWTVRDEILHALLDRTMLGQGIKPYQLPDLRPEAAQRPKNVMGVSDFAAWARRQQRKQQGGGEDK